MLNKIDLPSAMPEAASQEIEDVIGIDASDAIRASAKTGAGVEDILEAMKFLEKVCTNTSYYYH